MIPLPTALARHFRDATGRVDFRALLRRPDERLVELGRGLTPDERAALYYRLSVFRPGFAESLAAMAAGIDVNRERRRLMRVLEVADEAELVGSAG